MLAWTSDITVAKNKLNEFALSHINTMNDTQTGVIGDNLDMMTNNYTTTSVDESRPPTPPPPPPMSSPITSPTPTDNVVTTNVQGVLDVSDAKLKYSAKLIYGSYNRERANFAQINILAREEVSTWWYTAVNIKKIGYFAVSKVNQACNLYPADSAENIEILKELESERIFLASL